MSRLITNGGNFAIFEYPHCDDPQFDLSDDGVLFIFGYKMDFAGTEIGVAKRFETGLKNHSVAGLYANFSDKTLDEVYQKENFDIDNSVVLIDKKINENK